MKTEYKEYTASKRRMRSVARLIATAAFMLLFLTAGLRTCYAASDTETLNSCGTVNRPLSVDPTGLSEGFSAVLYDNMNGLPTPEANAIAETSDGFLWIGSYAGLIRYDGNTFERLDSTGGLTSIKCLYVDSSDRLWIGTNDNGVAVMEKGELKRWGKLDGMSSAHTRAITEGADGTIYIATTAGIMTIDKDYNLKAMSDPDIKEADMRYLTAGNDGVIYGTTDNGDLLTIKDGSLEKYIRREDNPLEGVGAMLPDPETPGRIYQEAADFGLYHVDLNHGFAVLEKINVEPLKYLMSMEYIDGKIWICAGNGIGVIDNGRFRLIENLPMNNNVGHVMTDYLGNLWFTSTRQGVMKVVPNQFADIFERYDIPETVVNSTSMCDGKLFIATDTGLIVIGDKGPLSELPINKAVTASGKDLGASDLIELLHDVRIRSIIRDSQDRLWISTWRACGLLRYDRGELTAFTEEDGMLSGNLRSVSEKRDGSVMVALTGGVNVIKDDSVIASYGKEDGIENDESLTVTEGEDGDIVLGSNGGGIYIINDSGVRNINVEDGLPSDIIMRLKRDNEQDIVWIVASNAIAYMTPDYKVTTIKKFPYPNNFDLYESDNGDMWILGSNGIYVTPKEELLENGEIRPVYYGIANGLACIATANSYSELTDDGDLYIAGSTGVCRVNIDKPFEDINDLKAVVPYVEADGERYYPDGSGTITIPSDTHKLTILGYIFNYSLSDPKVSCRLEGSDRESTTVNRSEMTPVDYTNLKGGTYNYVMHLMDALGRGGKVVSIRIVKEMAFYEEAWFYALIALVVLTALIVIVRAYVRKRTRILERKNREAHEQFEQTAEALANAIDAKDAYTNGHSRRVAEYSMRIAKESGRSEEECDQVYFAALLHDVGKIGVPIGILTKKGKLTDEEFEHIKQHPVVGGQILSSIRNSPWLSVGARYHHERYNGKGYPEGLKGDEIPEIARIIAVADAYDAMTSNRSYRDAIPQHIVREEIVKGIGTQFDPEFAKVMIHMIDLDTEYRMQESQTGANLSPRTKLRCETLYHDCTEGISITKNMTEIRLCSHPDSDAAYEDSLPSLIVFDSLDGGVHPGEEKNRNLLYFEYARIRLDGKVEEHNIRKSEVSVTDNESSLDASRTGEPESEQRYVIQAVRYRDHMLVTISDENRTIKVILALPDTSRFAYISIGGEKCFIHNINVDKSDAEIGPDVIPRITEEISFIKGCPVGDIPNIQVDSWCGEATEGIPVGDGLTLKFHGMSLPVARLVWHCPYISVFSSANGQRDGAKFREYLLLRMNGEDWSSDEHVENDVRMEQRDDFEGWNVWKEKNKEGMDYTVEIRREENTITMRTENLGIALSSTTTILDGRKDIYVAITGDLCAVTDIHILRNE